MIQDAAVAFKVGDRVRLTYDYTVQHVGYPITPGAVRLGTKPGGGAVYVPHHGGDRKIVSVELLDRPGTAKPTPSAVTDAEVDDAYRAALLNGDAPMLSALAAIFPRP